MKAVSYENSILTVSITNKLGEDSVYSDQYILAKDKDGNGYGHMNRIRQNVDDPEDAAEYEIENGETQELSCDLRVFGKVEPGRYMLILDNMQTVFDLVEEEKDTGETLPAPWFCNECGTKNYDTNVCKSCGTSKK